eukprot:TRINITY_DN5636_c0_g1_i1.p1 TRINITY_DN5636_c0_g1~~TRINITY_DN5636_c0_g1_i1.p1  ORF type:complete len:186 (+),score=50.37 TRINITY_DN5636_c0_g1_i1:145-702(+)
MTKSRGNTRVFFLAGQRAVSTLDRCLKTEKALTAVLKSGPNTFVDLVKKIQQDQRDMSKQNQNFVKQIAALKAELFAANCPPNKLAIIHEEDMNLSYLQAMADALQEKVPDVIFFGTAGGSAGVAPQPGEFLFRGPEAFVQNTYHQVVRLLEAKAGGKKGSYQGKIPALNPEKQDAVAKLLSSMF